MLYINEWLPNPLGADAGHEWIELFNSGDKTADLSGWHLINSKGKSTLLHAQIEPGSFLVLEKPDISFALSNNNESLVLLNTRNQIVDRSEFVGAAPEGKSFARHNGYFQFGTPTPGKANPETNIELINFSYPAHIPLNPGISLMSFLSLLFGVAALLTATILFMMKRNETISYILFGRN